jgi:hypothetical protein
MSTDQDVVVTFERRRTIKDPPEGFDPVEAKRVHELLVELTAKGQDTPPAVLDQLFFQQETLLGGVAKAARGWREGTQVRAHGRLPWELEEKAAKRHAQALENAADDPVATKKLLETYGLNGYTPQLCNRRDRREWAKRNPLRTKPVRLFKRRYH